MLQESSSLQIKDGDVVSSVTDASFVEHKDGELVASVTDASLVENKDGEVEASVTDASFVNHTDDQPEDDLPPPPSPLQDDFPPPPLDLNIPVPAELDPPELRSSYAALVTPTGFISPNREEADASRRSFANRLILDLPFNCCYFHIVPIK